MRYIPAGIGLQPPHTSSGPSPDEHTFSASHTYEPPDGEFKGTGTNPISQGAPPAASHDPCALSSRNVTHESGLPATHAAPFHEIVLLPPCVKDVALEGEMLKVPLVDIRAIAGFTLACTALVTALPEAFVQVSTYWAATVWMTVVALVINEPDVA